MTQAKKRPETVFVRRRIVPGAGCTYHRVMSWMTHRRLPVRTAGLVLIIALGGFALSACGGGDHVDGAKVSLWSLFWQSADLFTFLLVVGSIAAAAVIVRCVMDIRADNIMPPSSEKVIRSHLESGRVGELRRFVERDDAFISRVLHAALANGRDRGARREAAELAAAEESGHWFRKIEPLNIIGNLGPLLGLAGTVWGMIIAFASLGETGGRAGPADLSIGISKALFHTLLGLMLAVPALTFFGFYRSIVDRLCTRAMALSSELVEALPAEPTGEPIAGQPEAE